ncbi:MAG: hypothetical protein QM753_06810 [Thermomicrobiales bacterium]
MALTQAAEVAGILKVSATDAAFLSAWKAAERWVANRCRWKTEPVEIIVEGSPVTVQQPVDVEALQQAIVLLTGRYLARRNSPDGLVGMGELGVMRVSAIDRDVTSLIAPHRIVVV